MENTAVTPAIDLIPAGVHATRRRRDRRQIYVAVVLITVFVLGAAGLHTMRRAHQVRRLVVQADKLRAETDVLNRTSTALTAELEQTRRILQEAERLRQGHRWSRLLSFLAERVPDSVLLVLVATDPSEPGRARASRRAANPKESDPGEGDLGPRAIAIRGYALEHQDQAAFLGSLKEQQVFDSVSLLHSKREPFLNGEGIAFTLTCHW